MCVRIIARLECVPVIALTYIGMNAKTANSTRSVGGNVKCWQRYTTPCSIMALATRTKPAMFAPNTRLSGSPYCTAVCLALR